MARNIRIDRSEAEFLTDLLMSSDNPLAKDIGDEIRDVFGMVSKEKELADNQWTAEQIAKAKESNAKPYEINKINPLLADIINAPVITERLDASERPKLTDDDLEHLKICIPKMIRILEGKEKYKSC